MKTLTYEQALSRAAALCSGSEHCSSDIHKKLLLWGLSPTQAEKAIAFLKKEKSPAVLLRLCEKPVNRCIVLAG